MSTTYTEVLQDVHRPGMYELISGHERPKYFSRPVVAFVQETNIHLKVTEEKKNEEGNQNPSQIIDKSSIIEEKFKTIGVQTDKRDSQTQTDPYSPPVKHSKGSEPEMLLLNHLTYGHGLPATINELDYIEEFREKKAFEGALPPTSDEASFILRRRLMDDNEIREWKKREDEITKIQREKLSLVTQALREREREVEEKSDVRVEEIKTKKTETKNRLVAKIQRRKNKILRKILRRKKELEKSKKRDIIEEYANFASRVYAGIKHEGLSLDKLSNTYEIHPQSLMTYEGIIKLEQQINPNYMETTINVKKIIERIGKSYTKLENIHRQELEKAQKEMTDNKIKPRTDDNDMQDFRRVSARGPTPIHKYNHPIFDRILEDQNAKENEIRAKKFMMYEEKIKSILFFQRLLRGRAIQNAMFEGKEKRLALIDELLIVSSIKILDRAEEERLLELQHRQKLRNAFLEAFQGEITSQALDELAKELVRFKQEAKITEFVQEAEKERHRREAEETGRRQAEEILRNREEIMYHEIMKTHQGTVDNFLSWITDKSINHMASRQAALMTKIRQDSVMKSIETSERLYNRQETIIKDLVSSFLIPNIERTKLQKQVTLEQKRFFDASKTAIDHVITTAALQKAK